MLEAALGHAYALAGRRDDALAVIRLIEQPPTEIANVACSVCIALVYAGLGDNDRVMAWLLNARDRHDNSLPFVPADPRYAPVAEDPRFQELVRWIRCDPPERLRQGSPARLECTPSPNLMPTG